MEIYPIPMVPGPVSIPQEVMAVYQKNYGSADLETEFLDLYNQTESNLRKILGTQNRIVIQTGEGMLCLWSALKSCLLPGDRVLAIATGVFGEGIGEMARSVGADVCSIELPFNQTISDTSAIEDAIDRFKPKMITAVHCETPSGTLNPLVELGRLKHAKEVPLLYVDAVASAGGTPVCADEWHIDLCLGGSQKCLSAPPAMSFLSVSDRAWNIVHEVNYVGYDALQPFYDAQKKHYFPYTPYWHGVAALNAGAELLLSEGLQNCFKRHRGVAAYCREELGRIGLRLFPDESSLPSPTVTAVHVPEGISWSRLDAKLRREGLVAAGSYGPLSGIIFRLGHMGTQADQCLVEKALDVLKKVLAAI
jgi:aspartate aminotransferase-like enzyme